MGVRHMSGPLLVDGIPVTPAGMGLLPSKGTVRFVDKAALGGGNGSSWADAYLTIAAAVAAAASGDQILVMTGSYDEAVVIPVGITKLRIIGIGNFGTVSITTTTTNATALTNLADDLTLINMTFDGDGTGSGMINYGSRLRVYSCAFIGATNGISLSEGTAAQVSAATYGTGSSPRLEDCVISGNTTGILILASDQGAITNIHILRCLFHDNSAADISESGGTASARFTGIDIRDNTFSRLAAGTEPTKYISLNADNGNKGTAQGNKFPTALAGGKNLVSTGLIWAGNFHTGGLSTTQPS